MKELIRNTRFRRVSLSIRLALLPMVVATFFLVSANWLLAMTESKSAALAETGFEKWGPNEHFPSSDDDDEPLFLVMNTPGIAVESLESADEKQLPEDSEVIGVEVGGQPCAFVLEALESRDSHVINATIRGQAVSATYCNLSNCVRVFSDEQSDQPLTLGVGGLDRNWQMVLQFDGRRYSQTSQKIPLHDVDHTRTTLADWKKAHPGSLIYSGEADGTETIQ